MQRGRERGRLRSGGSLCARTCSDELAVGTKEKAMKVRIGWLAAMVQVTQDPSIGVLMGSKGGSK